MTETAQTTQVYSVFIKATPEQIWDAITKPEFTQKYFYGSRVELGGDRYRGLNADGNELVTGELIEVDPPRRLVQSFTALWSDEVKAQGTSRVTWDIEQVEDSCQLTVTHDQLPEDANPELYGGWPMILSGLKTLLETGEELTTPGSLRYAGAGA